jgi:uncharacterized protein (DUF58 family)
MPTRPGWAALAVAAASLVVGRVFGLIELYVLGTGAAAAVVVAVLVVQRRLPPLDVDRVARPAMVTVDEPARVDLRLFNLGRRSTPSLDLWEPVGDGGAPMQLAPLPPDATVTAAYRVPTDRRGLVQTGPLRTERRDVLGLASKVTVLPGGAELLVVPRHVPLPFPTHGSAGPLGEHLRRKAWGLTGSEFHSLREYVPGDDLRRVNWKASARSTSLLVRETEQEGVRRCTVVLDTSSGEYTPDAFEHAVSAAASVVTGADAAGVHTRLVAAGIDLRGPDVAARSLEWLATVEPTVPPTAGPSPGVRHPGDGLGLVVLVTGHATSAAAAAAATALAPDEALVVVCAAESPASRGLLVDGTTLDRLVAGWGALVLGARALAGAPR